MEAVLLFVQALFYCSFERSFIVRSSDVLSFRWATFLVRRTVRSSEGHGSVFQAIWKPCSGPMRIPGTAASSFIWPSYCSFERRMVSVFFALWGSASAGLVSFVHANIVLS